MATAPTVSLCVHTLQNVVLALLHPTSSDALGSCEGRCRDRTFSVAYLLVDLDSTTLPTWNRCDFHPLNKRSPTGQGLSGTLSVAIDIVASLTAKLPGTLANFNCFYQFSVQSSAPVYFAVDF